ncbi:MAG TPA: DUF4215 domain-containing protein [Polyangiaceae bacterium]|nr:DUF4215 domain-containing protein [Polyangiaceae bacterium]
MTKALRKVTFVALAAFVSAGALSACSSTPSSQPTGGGVEAPNNGTVGLAIDVGGGLTVNSVSYSVTGNGQNVTGTIDTSDPNSTPSVQIGLPQGNGYTVSLSATATNGVHCAGSQTFNVTAGATSTIFVNLQCDAQNNGDNIGGTIVNGTFIPGNAATCPDIAYYAVSPLTTSTGQPFTLAGAGTAGTTTTVWTADQGTVTAGTGGAGTYVCATAGDAHLTFTITDGKSCTDAQTVTVHCVNPGVCGNNVLEAGEGCDDGNTVSGDGCSATCVHEIICGDSVREGSEQCDPPQPGFCSATCQNVPAVCGDGFLQTGEQCDDGNTANGDGCDSTCHTVAVGCGDGVVQAALGETCDPPAAGTCDASCHQILPCGNGVIEPALGEECDPPNTKFCDATCHLGGACTTCEEANCGGASIHTACTGGANATECINAIDCARDNNCYQLDPGICYCGAHDIVACQSTAGGAANGPVGPCVTQFTAAASSGAGFGQVLLDLTDPGTALGRAGFMMSCDQAFCTAQCF